MPLWLKEKLWMGELIAKETGFEGDILYPEHHQSHAASAFFPSPYERAAILTMDGVGEWATASWGVGVDNKIELQAELKLAAEELVVVAQALDEHSPQLLAQRRKARGWSGQYRRANGCAR